MSLGGGVTQSGSPLAAGARPAQGSVVETGADGSATPDLADGSVITRQKPQRAEARPDASASTASTPHTASQLQLGSGRVEAQVKPHRDVGRFEISTPVAVSAVRGTQFRDGFDAATDHATAETLDGSVDVGSAARSVPVPAGFGTRVERGAAPLAPIALLPPPDLSGVPATATDPVAHIAWAPVAGAGSYRIQVADDRGFQVLLADLAVGAAAADLPTLPEGVHWLRVRSIDTLGLEGRDAVMQLTRHRLPDAPSLQQPPDGAGLTGTATAFTWSSGAAPARFRLQVAPDPAFANVAIARDDLAGNGIACCDLPAGRYFWRVAGVDDHGDSGPWSAVRSYLRRADAPQPEAPGFDGKTLRLAWPAVASTHYRIEVAHDAAFARIVLAQQVDETSLTVPKPFPGTYYARVQLLDADGVAGPCGAVRRFEVPVPLWVKIVAPVAVLLPLIL